MKRSQSAVMYLNLCCSCSYTTHTHVVHVSLYMCVRVCECVSQCLPFARSKKYVTFSTDLCVARGLFGQRVRERGERRVKCGRKRRREEACMGMCDSGSGSRAEPCLTAFLLLFRGLFRSFFFLSSFVLYQHFLSFVETLKMSLLSDMICVCKAKMHDRRGGKESKDGWVKARM